MTRPTGQPPAPRPEPTPPAERPSLVQIWIRSLVIGAVLGLFVAVGFGRFETSRVLTIWIVAGLIITVIAGLGFTWLNRERPS